MAVCVTVNFDNSLLVDTVAQAPNCPFVLYTGDEYTTILGFNQLFATYFDFDVSFFTAMFTLYIVTFIGGHVIGRVVARLRA